MDEIREKRGADLWRRHQPCQWRLAGQTWQGGMASANERWPGGGADPSGMGPFRQGRRDRQGTERRQTLSRPAASPLRFDGNGKIAGILAGMQLIGHQRYVNTRNTPRVVSPPPMCSAWQSGC